MKTKFISRRDFLKAGGLTLLGALGAAGLARRSAEAGSPAMSHAQVTDEHSAEGMPMPMGGEVDHAANGFVALIERLMPDFDLTPIRRISKKLDAGILLEAKEVHEALALLKRCEDRLIKFKRSDLTDAANTEMINIELERMGIKEAA